MCTVVKNREWIIGYMLESLSRQDYPRDLLFYLLIDGLSRDRTVDIAREALERYGIRHEIVVRETSIPEARNLCIERARGEILVFWDSDVVASSSALRRLVETLRHSDYHIIAGETRYVSLESPERLRETVRALLDSVSVERVSVEPVATFVNMGFTGIKREVFGLLRFDEELTYSEDRDFCERALARGLGVGLARGLTVYDIDVRGAPWSNIYESMSLGYHLRGISKKARLELYAYGYRISLGTLLHLVKTSPSRALYITYLFLIPSSLIDEVFYRDNTLLYLLIMTLSVNLVYQLVKRGPVLGLRGFLRNILFGVPYGALLLYHILRLSTRQYLEKRSLSQRPRRGRPTLL